MDRLLKDYEKATNTHDWKQVASFVHPKATYFFTDGTFIGIEEVKTGVNRTFNKIKNEAYTVGNIQWIYQDENVAICTYNFYWKGMVDGTSKEGRGRGTNVWKNTDGKWQIIHEHLSK
jgi:ketosteroid isomerase-like protein